MIFVVLFLILITILTLVNLVSTIKLRRQTDYILKEVFIYTKTDDNLTTGKISFNGIDIPSDTTQLVVVDASGNIIAPTSLTKLFEKPATSTQIQIPVATSSQVAPPDIIEQPLITDTPLPITALEPSAAGVEATAPEINTPPAPEIKKHHNVASESFFNSYYIDSKKTNLHFDNIVTALSFTPLYDYQEIRPCDEPFCGIKIETETSCLNDQCLVKKDLDLYYQNKLLVWPEELANKNVSQVNIHPLKSYWAVSFIFNEANQEAAYVYIFKDKKFIPLINNLTSLQIRTKYGRGNGYLSVGGSDNNFIILYSGYEGIAYLYNNGIWQDLSMYFSLRVTNGGFKSQIIRSGDGVGASWYVCGGQYSAPKFIKLWQNNTNQIQGALDLSSVIGAGEIACRLSNDKEIDIAKAGSLARFTDKGFDNSHDYLYESSNFNNMADKKVVNAQLRDYTIHAPQGAYQIYLSNNKADWQIFNGELINFTTPDLGLYFKAEFKAGNNYYSPWFNGLESIFYQAIEE